MTTRSKYVNGVLTFYDDRTGFESVRPLAPCLYEEDFLSNLVIPASLTAIDVSTGGDSTPLIAADAANGIARLPLDVTSEAQESGLFFNNQRPFILNQGLIIEIRLALATLPTLLSEAVWGLAGDKNPVADTVAESIWFKADGDGVIVAESDDTAVDNDDKATGVTVTAGLFKTYRIDCSNIASIKFYIDGLRVAEAITFNMSTVAGLKLQPYIHNAKASGAGLGVVDVDYIRAWQRRAA